MFENITSWFKGVWGKLFNKDKIEKSIGTKVAISEVMKDSIENWEKCYTGNAPWLTKDIKSLRLEAAISAEFARLATIEMEYKITGSARADFLNEAIKPLLRDLRKNLEYGIALGGIAIVPFKENQTIAFSYPKAGSFYPTRFDSNGNIMAAAFVDQIKKGDATYTKVTYRDYKDGVETITNRAYMNKDNQEPREISISQVEEWAKLTDGYITNLKRPLFAYYKNPIANEIDPTSPLGVSAFHRALDLIKAADEQWWSFVWENESGRRALYVDSIAFKKDEYGNVNVPDKRLYKTLDTQENDFYQEWSPQLRNDQLTQGLDAILKRIEFNSGLAYGTISDPAAIDKTATEVLQSRQRSYATVSDIQKALEDTLNHVVYIMDIWATLYKLAPSGKYETAADWDDSIVSDRATEFEEKLRLKNEGVLRDEEVRAWYTGETLEQAKANLPQAEELNFPGVI